MNWSERTVSNALQVERYTINDIIVSYLRDEFYVNRRYQRKLVWDIDEKCLLIDSIMKGIPLPAILLVRFTIPESDSNILEIVDGMQRLNAITSFVLGEFGIKYNGKTYYFDPNSYNETFQLLRDGKIETHDSLLPKDVCLEFTRYQIPAIITGKDDDTVEMIFSRINSAGRKISMQDLRQSMAVGEFPDLVRRIASRIRGDYTHDDRICLSDMPKISIGSKQHGYGVDIDSVFWRKHDLINSFNIRESKDEEIIETLVATVLLKGHFRKSKDTLDKLYKKETPLSNDIEMEVKKVGKDELENRFAKIFDMIEMIFESVNSNFSSYIFSEKKINNKDECFKILFLALYDLVAEGYIITDYATVAESIKNASDIFDKFTKTGKVDYNRASLATENLYKILVTSFSKEIATKSDKMTEEIDKRLSYSKIERQMTEFKVGISDYTSLSVNLNCIADIAKTLVAMSNLNNLREEGFVIVGIADNKKSYDAWYKIFCKPAVIINQHYIPGISCEAKKLHKNTDAYYREVRKLIKKEPITSKLKDYILETFEIFDYHGVELLIFKSKNVGEVSLYNNVKYTRHSNETLRCDY